MLFSRNGEVLEYSEKIYDSDSSYPQKAVYTSIRTYHGKPFCLDHHLNRLRESAELKGFPIPFSIDVIREWIQQLISRSDFEPRFLRITSTPKNLFILSRPLEIDPIIYEGVRVSVEPAIRDQVKIKAVDTPQTLEAYDHAQKEGFYEALLLNEEKNVITEGSRSNIFWMKDDVLFWCDESLSGITQRTVLELATKIGVPTQQSFLSYDNLVNLDEFFLTQTSRGIVPITGVQDITIGAGKPGAMTRQLMQAFQDLTSHI